MDSRRLKTFLIAVLAVVALAVGIFTVRDSVSRNYISEDMINNAAELLLQRGIVLDGDVIDRRIIKSANVLYAEFDRYEYCLAVARHLSGSGRGAMRLLPDGCEIISQNKDVTSFDGVFNISYKTDAIIPQEFAAIDAGDAASAEKVARAYIGADSGGYIGQSDDKLSYRLISVGYDGVSGTYMLSYAQTYDKVELGGFELELYIREEELVGAEGRWCFAYPARSYSSQIIDVINILFKEREYVAGLNSVKSRTVEEIKRLYLIYESSDLCTVYFTPGYRIEYEGGEARMYNAVSGESYAD